MCTTERSEIRVGTARVITRCRCGHTRAVDYTTETVPGHSRSVRTPQGGELARWVPARLVATYRIDPATGRRMQPCQDLRCPKCGREAYGHEVRGRVTEQTCGARCLASKGPQCDCACGGRNHGRDYL